MISKWCTFLSFYFLFGIGIGYCADGVSVDKDWLTLRDVSLDIVPESALDFSKFFPEQISTKIHPVVQGPTGQLEVAGKRQRFLCAPMVLTPPYGGFPTHDQADRYALQLRRAGYNLVRFMHVETTLMTDQKIDFDYASNQFDRFHYFLAALKKQGIYWMVDAMTSDNGSYGDVKPHRWIAKHDLKRRMYFDPAAKTHWRQQVVSLLGRVNPYTGKTIIEDDALLGLITVNEGGLNFLSHVGRAVPAGLAPQLSIWLKAKYTKQEFESRWKQRYSVLDDGSLLLPNVRQPSQQMDDVLRFYEDLQYETGKWMEAQLRQIGFRGLVTGFNNMSSTSADRARSTFGWIDMHAYHDEGFGFKPGASINNTSSYADGLTYVRNLAAARQSGKAFTVSEYGQPFWNQWRREMVAVPAYAALHDWDAICQHASTSVDLSYAQASGWKQSIHPYAVGLDPVARAVETLAALLYRRGDVKASTHHIDLLLSGNKQGSTANYWGVNAEVMAAALVVKTMTNVVDEHAFVRNSTGMGTITPNGDFKINRSDSSLKIIISSDLKKSDIAQVIALSVDKKNKTSATKGVFESITNEIKLNTVDQSLNITTPKTEVLVLNKAQNNVRLGNFYIKSTTGPALLGFSALDDKILDASRHILMIVANDAVNTEMRFEDLNRHKLVALGRLPARLEPIAIEFSLKTTGKNIKITPLSMSGKKYEGRVFTADNLSIDWKKQAFGPTTFYEIEIE